MAWPWNSPPAHLHGQLRPSNHHGGLWPEDLCGCLWSVSGYQDLGWWSCYSWWWWQEWQSWWCRLVQEMTTCLQWEDSTTPNPALATQWHTTMGWSSLPSKGNHLIRNIKKLWIMSLWGARAPLALLCIYGHMLNIARTAKAVQCPSLSGHNDCQESRFSTVWNVNNFTKVHNPHHFFVMAFVFVIQLKLLITNY